MLGFSFFGYTYGFLWIGFWGIQVMGDSEAHSQEMENSTQTGLILPCDIFVLSYFRDYALCL